MPVKYTKPPQVPYRYDKPSARCPMCRGKLFEQIWHNGERVYTTRPHCSSFTVYQKPSGMEDEFAAQTEG